MLKAIATFTVGFVGTILFLNAITWLFGQAVAAILAWIVAAIALVVIVIGLTMGGHEVKPMSDKDVQALKDYWQKT